MGVSIATVSFPPSHFKTCEHPANVNPSQLRRDQTLIVVPQYKSLIEGGGLHRTQGKPIGISGRGLADLCAASDEGTCGELVRVVPLPVAC